MPDMSNLLGWPQRQPADPLGTAGSFGQLLVVEASPDELAGIPPRPTGCRVVTVEGDTGSRHAGYRWVLLFQKPPGAVAAYERQLFVVPSAQLGAIVEACLKAEPDLAQFEGHRQDDGAVRDLLVGPEADWAAYQRTGKFRVWRINTPDGGAMVYDLPQGRCWNGLGPDSVDELVDFSGPMNCHYCGWACLSSPYEQAVERAVWQQEGPAWVGYRKAGRLLYTSKEGDWAEVRIGFVSPDGTVAGFYEAAVAVECDLAGAPEYRVVHLEKHRILNGTLPA